MEVEIVNYSKAVEMTKQFHELEQLYRETWKEPKNKSRSAKLEKISKQLEEIYNQLPKFCY